MADILYARANQLLDAVDQLILGKRHQATLILASWLARGHVLLDDVPGVAKTRLARVLAQLTGLSFARIQGSPDLLPQDITGGLVYDLKSSELKFRAGPVFHHIVLVDEINRTTPRSQAALLECMEERQVTADGVTHLLPDPFLIVATQNPVEMEGTFPLPEAELDRFLISLSLGYPTVDDERALVKNFSQRDPIDDLSPLFTGDEVSHMVDACRQVAINTVTLDYLISLCRLTRTHPLVDLGASPRTSLRFAQVARAYAWLQQRTYVTPDDIKLLAPHVLGHRLVPSPSATVSRIRGQALVEQIVADVPVPVEDA
ncbi:MAG: magnesium chelatase [Sulfobacillus acidophilus]|uniref:Magnesium chelatase n=1 Tax=Sulfobacillus acidophilus TaxID=53633 RepID=A0A2T2WMR3_9FIRM|nr:MAG: magnesium chelatase [Sulfobacillus acidophilus]